MANFTGINLSIPLMAKPLSQALRLLLWSKKSRVIWMETLVQSLEAWMYHVALEHSVCGP